MIDNYYDKQMKSINENLYSFWCMLGDSEIYNDIQDITFAPIETKTTLSSIVGTSNLPSEFNDNVYHIATFWKHSETEIIILYDINDESLVAWCKDTNKLIASRSDAFDLTLLVLEGKSTHQIFDILFIKLQRATYKRNSSNEFEPIA